MRRSPLTLPVAECLFLRNRCRGSKCASSRLLRRRSQAPTHRAKNPDRDQFRTWSLANPLTSMVARSSAVPADDLTDNGSGRGNAAPTPQGSAGEASESPSPRPRHGSGTRRVFEGCRKGEGSGFRSQCARIRRRGISCMPERPRPKGASSSTASKYGRRRPATPFMLSAGPSTSASRPRNSAGS